MFQAIRINIKLSFVIIYSLQICLLYFRSIKTRNTLYCPLQIINWCVFAVIWKFYFPIDTCPLRALICQISYEKKMLIYSTGPYGFLPFTQKIFIYLKLLDFDCGYIYDFFSGNFVTPAHSLFGTPSTKIIQILFCYRKNLLTKPN